MTITVAIAKDIEDYHLPSWIRVKRFGPSTDFLVSSTVRDPNYRTAVSLGIPVVRPSFLASCARLENEAAVQEESRHHFLPRFSGTLVYFLGFSDKRWAIVVGENVVHNLQEATHIVVAQETDLPTVSQSQFLVNSNWIRETMDLGWMANEINFEVTMKRNRLRRRSAKVMRKFSKKNNLDPVDSAGAQKYKRYQLCRELYMSEINCLKVIDFLIRMSKEENSLSFTHIDVIFGSFPEQKKLHSELVAKLGKVLDGWNDYSQIGSIFVDLAIQLEEAYVPYFQGLTAALELFKECKNKSTKFRNFVKEKEKDRSIDKQKIEYLLNVPMQQITSRIGVTLKEILLKTDASLADHVFIRSAIDVVDDVLRKCNNFKKESSESELIYRQARILCSSRRFLSRCQFSCVQSPAINLPVPVELLLFEDVLMITRGCREAQISCATLGQKQKRAKFVDVYPMAGVRQIQLRSRTGEPPLVEMVLRRAEGDFEWQYELAQELEETMKFLNQMIEQVEKVCNRTIFIRTVSAAFCPKTPEASKLSSNGFVRSLSSTSAFKNIRSYSQRLRLRRNISADVQGASPKKHVSSPEYTPRRPVQKGSHKKDVPSCSSIPSSSHRISYHCNQTEEEKEQYNERCVDIPPPRPRTPPGQQYNNRQFSSTPIIQEVDSEEEHVNPYEVVKFFSPLKNLNSLRHHSIMDEWC